MGLKLGRREQFKNLEVEILRGSWSECEPEHGKTFAPTKHVIRERASTIWAVSKHGTLSSNVHVPLRDPQLRQTASIQPPIYQCNVCGYQ
jgi:hypothetical protein